MHVSRCIFTAIALLGLGAIFATPVHATLIGQTVSACTNSFADFLGGVATTDTAQCSNSEGDAVVGAGSEFFLGTERELDLDGDTVTIIYPGNISQSQADLWIVSGLNWGPTPGIVVGLELLTADPLNITTAFTSTSIRLLVNNDGTSAGEVTFRILTRHVPEPGSLALTALALGGLLRGRRRAAASR